MWSLLWDTIGYFADNVPRSMKIFVLILFAAIVYFFWGFNPMIYAVGGLFWIGVAFLVIAHIVIVIRKQREKETAPPAPLTPADQADITEFQEAMEQEVGDPQPDLAVQNVSSPKKAAPPQDLPER